MRERFHLGDLSRSAPWRLEGDEARHLARVLRLGVGAEVELFDGRGTSHAAEVTAVAREYVELRPLGLPLPDRLPAIDFVLATAVPKGERFDWLVEKATEIGVSRLIPLECERSVVVPRPGKLDRARRAVIEACKQSGRNRFMRIDETTPFAAITPAFPDRARYLAHPGVGRFEIEPTRKRGRPIVLAVGPEGGFTDGEVGSAVLEGWTPVGLGATILRIETACLVGAARALAWAEWNELSGSDP